jgi:hypothetical protein
LARRQPWFSAALDKIFLVVASLERKKKSEAEREKGRKEGRRRAKGLSSEAGPVDRPPVLSDPLLFLLSLYVDERPEGTTEKEAVEDFHKLVKRMNDDGFIELDGGERVDLPPSLRCNDLPSAEQVLGAYKRYKNAKQRKKGF